MNATLLVLAAGMGSRFGGVKQIQPVGSKGEAIPEYSVFDAHRAGFDRIVFVIRKDIERDFKRFLNGRFKNIRTDIVFQSLDDVPNVGSGVDKRTFLTARTKPWGTGQAILAARHVVHEPFAVINADDFYGRDAYRVLHRYLSTVDPKSHAYAMVGYPLRRTLSEFGSVSRGICSVDGSGFLRSVDEHTKIQRNDVRIQSTRPDGSVVTLSGDETASMNLFGFTPMVFEQLERLFAEFICDGTNSESAEFYIPAAVNRLIREDAATVRVLTSQAEWFGMTYREDVSQVTGRIRVLEAAGEYPVGLWT